MSKLDELARRACIVEQVEAAESRLGPEAGVIVQAVWFDAGAEQAGRLLLTIHHLAVDGVSWRILVPDLGGCLGGDRRRPVPRRWSRAAPRFGDGPNGSGPLPRSRPGSSNCHTGRPP